MGQLLNPHRPDGARAHFDDLFRDAYPDVLAFLRRRVGQDAAEDVAAEVFTIAWSTRDRAPQDVRPWLFGIARHLAVDNYRAQERRRRLDFRLSIERTQESDASALTDMSIDLRRAWVGLTDTDREVLALVAWDGLTGREAAAVLGCTRAAFSVRLTRARRRLKALMSSEKASRGLPPAAQTGIEPVFEEGSCS